MRTLHVAALPFPSAQGTQALLHAMLSALHGAGHAAELLCYDQGAGEFQGPYRLLRAHGWVRGSLRSGPSLAKLALDLGLASALRGAEARSQPQLVVAHHVEAALVALAVSRAPVVYVAHTSLEFELPFYLPSYWQALASKAGASLERQLCRRAAATLAVSPLLASMLSASSGANVQPLVLPWALPESISEEERASARSSLGLALSLPVLLYAGNLDAYQGLDVLTAALRRLRSAGRAFSWLIATESSHRQFARALAQAGLAETCVRFTGLGSEQARRAAHAASDLVMVPRASPGGVPIKLLDALARGVRVITCTRACAGLPLAEHCLLAEDDDPDSWSQVMARWLDGGSATGRASPGREHMRAAHDPAAFVADLEQRLAALTRAS